MFSREKIIDKIEEEIKNLEKASQDNEDVAKQIAQELIQKDRDTDLHYIVENVRASKVYQECADNLKYLLEEVREERTEVVLKDKDSRGSK